MGAVESALSQLSGIHQAFQAGQFATLSAAEQAIKDLTVSLSAAASGPGGVLYSGFINDTHSSIIAQQIAQDTGKSIIDNTDRAIFLKNPLVRDIIASIYQEAGVADSAITAKVQTFIAGGQDLLS